MSVDLTPEILPPRTRDEYGRWLPGRSPHPGGLAPEKRLALDLAKEASPDAMRCLIGLMKDPASPPAVRLASAAQILDRALGRPKQSVEVENKGQSLEEMLYAIHETRAANQARACAEGDRLVTSE
jgi:hypothetical protein